jgi:hypothetical protein
MNYSFISGDCEGFYYAIATELPEVDALYYFWLNRSQRRSDAYEPPEHPVYRVGTIMESIDGDWIARANIGGDRFTGTLDECKAYLISMPVGDAFDLARIDRNA